MKAKILLLVLSGLLVLTLGPAYGQEVLIDRPVENVAPGPEVAASQPETKANVLPAVIPAETKPQSIAKMALPEKPAKPVQVPVYKVQSGDSLIVIAKAYGVSVAGIMQANNLNSSSLLRVGQSLKIPGGEIPAGKKSASSGAAKPAASQPAAPSVPETQPAAAPEGELFAEEKTDEASESFPAAVLEEANPTPLFGEENAKSAGPNMLGGAGSLLSLGLKLGFVILLAYVAARAARQFALRKGKFAPASVPTPAPRPNHNMEILETITLGPERWLHVVTIGSKAYLLSSTPQQTALITEVTETNLIQELREKQALESGFAGQLAQMMASGREPRTVAAGPYPNNYFTAKLAALNPFGGRQ